MNISIYKTARSLETTEVDGFMADLYFSPTHYCTKL